MQKARLLDAVHHRASPDALTGLPDPVLFLVRLQAALAAREAHVAVLFCDLDGFKQINDTLGHAVGDELLRQHLRRARRTSEHRQRGDQTGEPVEVAAHGSLPDSTLTRT